MPDVFPPHAYCPCVRHAETFFRRAAALFRLRDDGCSGRGRNPAALSLLLPAGLRRAPQMQYPGRPLPVPTRWNPSRSLSPAPCFPVPAAPSLSRSRRDLRGVHGSVLPADGFPGSCPRRIHKVLLSFLPAVLTRSLSYSLPDIFPGEHSLPTPAPRSFPGICLPGTRSPPGSYRRSSARVYMPPPTPPSLSFFREDCWSF